MWQNWQPSSGGGAIRPKHPKRLSQHHSPCRPWWRRHAPTAQTRGPLGAAPQPVQALAGQLVQHRVRALLGHLEVERAAELGVRSARGGCSLRRLAVPHHAAPGAVPRVPAAQPGRACGFRPQPQEPPGQFIPSLMKLACAPAQRHAHATTQRSASTQGWLASHRALAKPQGRAHMSAFPNYSQSLSHAASAD